MLKKDFFAKLKEQGRINNPDFDKFIEGIKDTEDFPDAVVKAIEDNFLTRERAAADKDIHGKIKREVLDPVDHEIKELFETLKEYGDSSFENIINTDQNTYNKVKAVKKLIPDALKKAKGNPVTDDETKKKLLDQEKTIQELTDKFSTAEKDYSKKIKETETTWESKFHDFRLGTELQNIGNKYTLAEAFEETRPAITEVIMSKIRQSNNLKLGEKDGRPTIIVNDENGKPKFNGNTPVTVENLLDEAYKPFLKKSESGGGGTRDNPKTTTKVDPPKTTIRRGAPTTVSKL